MAPRIRIYSSLTDFKILSGTFLFSGGKRGNKMITPDLNQIKEYALSGKYKTVPVSMEILSDIKTDVYKRQLYPLVSADDRNNCRKA